MTTIASNVQFDRDEVAGEIMKWFMDRNFDVEQSATASGVAILAGKKGLFRTVLCAARSFHVDVLDNGGFTQVQFCEDSWMRNLAANAGWAILTGGANLAFSAWSLKVRNDFKKFIRELLCIEMESAA